MCFDQPTSYGFAATGLVVALYANRKLKASGEVAARGADRFSAGLLYFVLMETLQGAYWLREQRLCRLRAVLCGGPDSRRWSKNCRYFVQLH